MAVTARSRAARIVRVGGGAAAAVLAIAGSAYAVVSTLPPPRAGDRTAVRVLELLERTRGTGATMTVGGRDLSVRCSPLRSRRHLLRLSDGTRLVLSGTRVSRLAPRRGLAAARTVDPETIAAEAGLAGSHAFYATQLVARLRHGSPLVRPTSVGSRAAYRIRLSHARPHVDLYVDRATLRPLAATYRSRTLTGRSVLAPSVPGRPANGC